MPPIQYLSTTSDSPQSHLSSVLIMAAAMPASPRAPYPSAHKRQEMQPLQSWKNGSERYPVKCPENRRTSMHTQPPCGGLHALLMVGGPLSLTETEAPSVYAKGVKVRALGPSSPGATIASPSIILSEAITGAHPARVETSMLLSAWKPSLRCRKATSHGRYQSLQAAASSK